MLHRHLTEKIRRNQAKQTKKDGETNEEPKLYQLIGKQFSLTTNSTIAQGVVCAGPIHL
jgi:hypothetical protein